MRKIHVEGKSDAQLLKSLSYPRKVIQRDNDKGEVCNKLEKSENEIGLIDEDKDLEISQPKYLRNLKLASNNYKIKVYEDLKRNNKLIVLCPRLEEWIIDVCRTVSIDMKQFGLSEVPNILHRSINFKLDNFDKLVKHLLEIKASPIIHLNELLNS